MTNASGISAVSTTKLLAEQSGLFASGGYALAVRFGDFAILSDTSLAAARAGDILELYATTRADCARCPHGACLLGILSDATHAERPDRCAARDSLLRSLIGAGLYQINITVPNGVATGTSQVAVTIGGQTSQMAWLRSQGN